MDVPGSAGEHELQERYGTARRAAAFYDKQMLDHLNELMREFIGRQEMAFVSTADAHGECDCTFRAGPAGFMQVLDDRTVVYPEYRGNGVMASLGNITENGNVGILFVDFTQTAVGLHVNGKASILEREDVIADPIMAAMLLPAGAEPDDAREEPPAGPEVGRGERRGPGIERWVKVEVEEAYIHCSKHIPQLRKLDKSIDWGTDDVKKKGGDHFKAKHSPRPWQVKADASTAAEPAAVAVAEDAGSARAAQAEAPAAEADRTAAEASPRRARLLPVWMRRGGRRGGAAPDAP